MSAMDLSACDRCGMPLLAYFSPSSPDAWNHVADTIGVMRGRHHCCDPSRPTFIAADELASLRAEFARVRRQNEDLQIANNGLLKRARDADAARTDMAKVLFASAPFCGFEKGDPILTTGGDYDADAKFVCAFEYDGAVHFIGAIPQKRGYLLSIFNPRQVTPIVRDAADINPLGHVLRASDSSLYDVRCVGCGATDGYGDAGLARRCPEAAPEASPPSEKEAMTPRRFRHRKRGSVEVLIGEAELRCLCEISDGSHVGVYRRNSDGKIVAIRTIPCEIDDAAWIGLAEVQTAQPLSPGIHTLTFYRGEADGRLWLRPVAEFNDGRFEELT